MPWWCLSPFNVAFKLAELIPAPGPANVRDETHLAVHFEQEEAGKYKFKLI